MALNEASVQKKFETLNSTQESIETVALWCLHHKEHHILIVSMWIKCFKTVPLKQRMSLLYVCNDVCQKERHKKINIFRKSFAAVLKEAFCLVRSDDIRSSIERILSIWKDREIFAADFINDLKSILATKALNNGMSKSSLNKETVLNDFKPENLLNELERHVKDTESLEKAQAILPSVPFNADGNIKTILKDRHEGLKHAQEIDAAYKKFSEFVEEFERKLLNKQKLIALLEQAEIFYETQMSEAKIVETAYRKFGSSVEIVRQELRRTTRDGPLTGNWDSPVTDAPSPSPYDDPFALGVEAVAAASKFHSNSEPVDMEIDEDGEIHSGLKVTTNRSFLSSADSANIEKLLFGSPSKDQASVNKLFVKSSYNSDNPPDGLFSPTRSTSVWAPKSAGGATPTPPQPPPVPLSRLNPTATGGSAGPHAQMAGSMGGPMGPPSHQNVRPTMVDPRSAGTMHATGNGALPPPPTAPPLDPRFGPTAPMQQQLPPAAYYMAGPPPGFSIHQPDPRNLGGSVAVPSLYGSLGPPTHGFNDMARVTAPGFDPQHTNFMGHPSAAHLYHSSTSPPIMNSVGPSAGLPTFMGCSGGTTSPQGSLHGSNANPLATQFAGRPSDPIRGPGPAYGPYGGPSGPQISPQATRVPQHVNHRMDWTGGSAPVGGGTAGGSGVNRSNLTVLGSSGSATPVRDDKDDSPNPNSSFEPGRSTQRDSDMRLLMRPQNFTVSSQLQHGTNLTDPNRGFTLDRQRLSGEY